MVKREITIENKGLKLIVEFGHPSQIGEAVRYIFEKWNMDTYVSKYYKNIVEILYNEDYNDSNPNTIECSTDDHVPYLCRDLVVKVLSSFALEKGTLENNEVHVSLPLMSIDLHILDNYINFHASHARKSFNTQITNIINNLQIQTNSEYIDKLFNDYVETLSVEDQEILKQRSIFKYVLEKLIKIYKEKKHVEINPSDEEIIKDHINYVLSGVGPSNSMFNTGLNTVPIAVRLSVRENNEMFNEIVMFFKEYSTNVELIEPFELNWYDGIITDNELNNAIKEIINILASHIIYDTTIQESICRSIYRTKNLEEIIDGREYLIYNILKIFLQKRKEYIENNMNEERLNKYFKNIEERGNKNEND